MPVRLQVSAGVVRMYVDDVRPRLGALCEGSRCRSRCDGPQKAAARQTIGMHNCIMHTIRMIVAGFALAGTMVAADPEDEVILNVYDAFGQATAGTEFSWGY